MKLEEVIFSGPDSLAPDREDGAAPGPSGSPWTGEADAGLDDQGAGPDGRAGR